MFRKMYAVVEMQGHQYIVAKDTEIVVDAIADKDAKKVDTDQVLMVFDEKGEAVVVGKPYVAKAKVSFDVVEHKKGDKIKVLKFKRKNRYERTYGFRPHQTILKVKSIKVDG